MSAGATCGGLREQILSAAGECFRNRGFKATTMHEIAKRAGMSVGNLYNYFDGKDAIVDELAKREIGVWQAKSMRSSTDECRLRNSGISFLRCCFGN